MDAEGKTRHVRLGVLEKTGGVHTSGPCKINFARLSEEPEYRLCAVRAFSAPTADFHRHTSERTRLRCAQHDPSPDPPDLRAMKVARRGRSTVHSTSSGKRTCSFSFGRRVVPGEGFFRLVLWIFMVRALSPT